MQIEAIQKRILVIYYYENWKHGMSIKFLFKILTISNPESVEDEIVSQIMSVSES